MTLKLSWIVLLVFLTSACAVQPPHGDPDPKPEPQCTVSERYQVTFCAHTGFIANPERGFHHDFQLANESVVRGLESDTTLLRSYVYLDDFITTDLPDQLLHDLQRGFDAVRAAGMKVIPRFAYNHGPEEGAEIDAETGVMLRHIEQLEGVLAANSDVIAVLQAGFIGLWGEWHYGHLLPGVPVDPAEKRAIATALLAALPPERMLQIRTPFHITDALGHHSTFEPGDAFTTSDQARIGFVNDCFLAGTNDVGTFPDESHREYARAMAPFTVIGGETCEHPEEQNRQQCPNTLSELAEYHWDYLNLEYEVSVIDGWREGGCFDEIRRRLGYRFELLGASIESPPGEVPVLTIGIRNSGFGKLYNPRPLQLVLVNGSDRRTITLAGDAREVLPLAGETIVRFPFPLTDLPAGTWQLELALPDNAESLRGNPAYSIRFASLTSSGGSIWTDRGTNRLGLSLQVPPN